MTMHSSSPSPVKVLAVLTARSNRAEDLKALLLWMRPHCRAEPGNLRWDVWQSESQRDCYVLDELYLDDAAAAAHHETPHYTEYLSRIADLADRTAFVLEPCATDAGAPISDGAASETK